MRVMRAMRCVDRARRSCFRCRLPPLPRRYFLPPYAATPSLIFALRCHDADSAAFRLHDVLLARHAADYFFSPLPFSAFLSFSACRFHIFTPSSPRASSRFFFFHYFAFQFYFAALLPLYYFAAFSIFRA